MAILSRRKKHEEHVNHEAWAIPYGDLITLLLAFFVVMYALSSVNEGKYRVLSDSLVAAFRTAPKSLEPIQIGEVSRSPTSSQVQQPRTLVPLEIDKALREAFGQVERSAEYEAMRAMGMTPEEIDASMAEIETLSALIGRELEELVASDQVELRENAFWLEIEINTSVLFPVASASLAADSLPIIRRIGEILATTESRIQVEGHTDDLPIFTVEFPSNWELSAARAASVVRMFRETGVDPTRMAAVGYGEFQPVGDNATVAGRAENRRVVVIVTASGHSEENSLARPPLELAGI